MLRHLPLIATLLLGTPALAEAGWTVGPLPPGEGLNLRIGPGPGFAPVALLPPGALPFDRQTCVRLITDPAESDAGKLPEWCLLGRDGQPLGWVAARYLIPAADALRIVRGWPGPADTCQLIGETALTGEFLDDSADLVGCPPDAPLPDGLHRLRPSWLGEVVGWRLFSVPHQR